MMMIAPASQVGDAVQTKKKQLLIQDGWKCQGETASKKFVNSYDRRDLIARVRPHHSIVFFCETRALALNCAA